MISSLKIKLNHSWKFQRNWNVPLVFLERSWWAGFNAIYLVKFGFRNVGDIDLKVISAAENSNKFPKNQVLEGKISWGRGNTWANDTGRTSGLLHLLWMAFFTLVAFSMEGLLIIVPYSSFFLFSKAHNCVVKWAWTGC